MEVRWPSKRQWEKLWARSQSGAKALFILGGLQAIVRFLIWVLDWKSRIEEAMETVGQLGKVYRELFSFVTSLWFGIILILLGLAYVIFVPAEDHPAETHPAIGVRVANAFVWFTVGACALLLWGTFVAGSMAIKLPQYIETKSSKELVETKRELAGVLEALMPRRLTEQQIEQMVNRLRIRPGVRYKVLYSERAIDDGPEYARQFHEVFKKAWGEGGSFEKTDSGVQRPEGVFVQVMEGGDISSPPLKRLVMDAFREADVKQVHFTDDIGDWGQWQVMVLVGAKPYLNESVSSDAPSCD